jgi:hypothetical protein
MQAVCGDGRNQPLRSPVQPEQAEIGDDMRQRARSAFLVAPVILTITLTAAVSACGSTAAPQSGHTAADASGRATGTSAAAIPPAARRVQCPAVIEPLVPVPESAKGGGPVRFNGPIQPAGPIPAGFKPVAVVECVTVSSVNHGIVRIEERRRVAVAGLGRLLAALREPSTPRPKGVLPACMVPVRSWPWLALVSATGQIVHPVVSAGLCGLPSAPVLASLNSLHWITLGTVSLPIGPLRPPLHGGPVHVGTPATALAN